MLDNKIRKKSELGVCGIVLSGDELSFYIMLQITTGNIEAISHKTAKLSEFFFFFHSRTYFPIYSRLSLSRNRRDPLKNFEISVLQHIRCVVLRKKQFEQPKFTNDYVI